MFIYCLYIVYIYIVIYIYIYGFSSNSISFMKDVCRIIPAPMTGPLGQPGHGHTPIQRAICGAGPCDRTPWGEELQLTPGHGMEDTESDRFYIHDRFNLWIHDTHDMNSIWRIVLFSQNLYNMICNIFILHIYIYIILYYHLYSYIISHFY